MVAVTIRWIMSTLRWVPWVQDWVFDHDPRFSKGSAEVVEEMHFAFIYAEDGSLDALDAWKRLLGIMKDSCW